VKIYIFTGPSLPRRAAQAIWREPAYLAPVAQGDVYRIARRKPAAIGITDGFFERLPAVWHKEILWALSKGIRVYSSSSMGALRAAELSGYGMIGVGSIYEDYASGALTDDDEVTLAHAPASNNYRPVSEPLVNIRYTLAKAAAAAIVAQPTARALAQIAKALFYPLRSYEKSSRKVFTNACPRKNCGISVPGSRLAESIRSAWTQSPCSLACGKIYAAVRRHSRRISSFKIRCSGFASGGLAELHARAEKVSRANPLLAVAIFHSPIQ
jgi:hypothetical protein